MKWMDARLWNFLIDILFVKKLRFYIAFLLIVLSQSYCFNCWTGLLLAAPSKEQLSDLQQQIKLLQKNLNKISQSKNQELYQLQKTDLKINELVQQIYQLDQKIDQLELDYTALDKEIKVKQLSLQEHQQILAGQLTASYHIGQQEFIKLLLNQQNPAVFSRVMSYYQYFHKARMAQIDRVTTIITELNEQRSQLQLMQQEIELQQYLKNKEKIALLEQQVQRNQLIDKLSLQQQDAQGKLKQLEQDEQQLKTLLDALQEAARKLELKKQRKPFAKSKGRLKWPLKGKRRKLYNHWRSVNKVKWKGDIILAPEGQSVYSISHGTVVYSDWLRGYGLLTIIDHGKGYMSLYGYSQALLKSVGDQVEQGEVIATAGRTSGRSKAGIYFEIRYNGKPVNPGHWCKKMPN